MSSRSVGQSLYVRQPVGTPLPHVDREQPTKELAHLNYLAIQSLKVLFDEQERLFSRRMVWTGQGFHREAISRSGTMIALLGLHRIEESGAQHDFNLAAIQEAILQDITWVRSAGDVGLLLWFTAVCAPERLPAVLNDFDVNATLALCADSRRGHTQGLAWFLAGVAHARQADLRLHEDLIDVAVAAFRKLLRNQRERGLFGHVASPRSVCEIVSTCFGTFADQIYAVYALTTFAQSFEIEEPLESALNCANALCALQGDRGQWWFRYDTRKGCVADRYPVYSAHQDGMAPTALLALEEATGQKFHAAVWKGLSWIAANNELGTDLRSSDQAVIWHSIETQKRITRHWETACSCLHLAREPVMKRLRIGYEIRPDHFGWLLYAFGSLAYVRASFS